MKRFIINEHKDLTPAMDALYLVDLSKPMEVVIQEYKPNRTLRQNATLWGWYYKNLEDSLAEGGIIIEDDDGKEWPYTADILHEMFREFFLVRAEIKRNGKIRKLYWSTADLPKSKPGDDGRPSFSEYIDKIKNFARGHWNIYLQDPGDEFY